jgi:hypothetical protein
MRNFSIDINKSQLETVMVLYEVHNKCFSAKKSN